MAKRFSRRPKVVWLPSDLEDTVGGDPVTTAEEPSQKLIALQLGGFVAPVAPVVITTPIVLDKPVGAIAAQGETLSDFEGSAYRLRRVVGKCFIQTPDEAADPGQPSQFFVAAGLIVLRVDEAGLPLKGATDAQYSTVSLENVRDPWIWRRSWSLQIQQANDGTVPVDRPFPASNARYGSVLDGPHLDAKTARVISDEERLFFVLSGFALNGDPQLQTTLLCLLDLRVLASMRSQSGNRRNASR